MYINTSYKMLHNAATVADLTVTRITAIDEYQPMAATLYEFHMDASELLTIMEKFNLMMEYLSRRNRLVFGRISCEFATRGKRHWIIKVPVRLKQRGEL